MVGAHRDTPRRDGGSRPDALGGVRQEALEDGGAQAGPDQPRRDMRVGRVELVQVRVRLPFLEMELDLLPEAIEPPDEGR
jgi:hypothetical protein